MIRYGEIVLRAAAAALAALFVVGATSDRLSPRAGAARTDARPGAARANHFHAGKPREARVPDAACQSQGCHGESPHRENRSEAAFLNMHGSSVECFACHGKDAENAWSGSGPGGGGRRIRNPLPKGKTEPHTLFGRPVSCRGCHSAAGRARLSARGVAALPDGFSDPIALRMMERGGKRWDATETR